MFKFSRQTTKLFGGLCFLKQCFFYLMLIYARRGVQPGHNHPARLYESSYRVFTSFVSPIHAIVLIPWFGDTYRSCTLEPLWRQPSRQKRRGVPLVRTYCFWSYHVLKLRSSFQVKSGNPLIYYSDWFGFFSFLCYDTWLKFGVY